MSTAALDLAAERFIRSHGATPTFKGYRGFPGSICASPNAMIVHGIPGPYRLKDGDIISIDVGVTLDGWVADAARTFAVGAIDREQRELLRATEAALHAGVAQCVAGKRIGDVSNAIQRVAEGAGLAVVRSLVGHGVGRSMHEDPQVPNYGRPGKGPLLEEGMALAIEPMTTAGAPPCGWPATAGRSTPRTALRRRISSSPSRSPPSAPLILTPWHIPPCRARAPSRWPSASSARERRRPGGSRACMAVESCASVGLEGSPLVRASTSR